MSSTAGKNVDGNTSRPFHLLPLEHLDHLRGLSLLPAWALLLARLSAQSMWIDEWFTADIARTPWTSFLSHIIATERRPPLHYILLKLWILLTGDSEYVMRLYSVMLAVMSVAVVYALGRRLLDHRTGMAGALLAAISPFVILYGRMIRAYSQTILLGTLATWLLLLASDRPTFRRWFLYGLATCVLLYTDYSGLAVLSGHALYVLARGMKQGRLIGQWLGTTAVAAASYAPWAPILLAQKEHPARLTDLAGGVTGLSLKLAYPFYAWGAGETIFPWHPAALPGVVACGVLLLLGLAIWARRDRLVSWLLVVMLAGPLVFTAALLTWVATDITFLNAASRSPAAAPIFYLGVAAGLRATNRFPLRLLALLCIGGAFVAALFNYYQGLQFHNPIYAVPIRQVVEQVRTASSANDLIVAEADTLFGYYYRQTQGPAAYQDADFAANQAWIENTHPARVWLVTFGRDSTSGVGRTEELASWLAERFPHVQSWGYVPQDPTYQSVKKRLLGRPAYAYKLLIRVYGDS